MEPNNDKQPQEATDSGERSAGSSQSESSHTQGSQTRTDTTQTTAEGTLANWSWGAFMFDLPFLIAVRKYAYILIYLLMLVPLLNFVVYIGLKIFLGIKGRKLAADSDMFANKEEMEGFMKGFDWAGKVLFFVALAVFLLGILLTIVFGVSAMNAVPDAGFSG